MDLSGLSDDQLQQLLAQAQQQPGQSPGPISPFTLAGQSQQATLPAAPAAVPAPTAPGPDLSGYSDAQLAQMAQAAQGGGQPRPLTITPAPPTNSAGAAYVAHAISGIPLAGPYMLGGMQRLSAFQRSMDNGTNYGDEFAAVQGADQARTTDHPAASTLGDITGGVIGTAPMIAAAPAAFGIGDGALAARALTGAGTGAVLGGADAGVRSNGTAVQRLADTAQGAGMGALFGGVAPAVGSALGNVYARLAGAPVQEAQGVPAAARQYLMDRVGNDGGIAAVQASLADLGPQAMLPDTGPSLRGIAQGLSTKPGPAQQPVMQALADRNLGTNARLNGVVDAQLGPAQSPTGYSRGLLGQAGDLGRQRAQLLNAAPDVDIAPVIDHIDDAIARTAPNSPQRAALQQAKGYLTTTQPADLPELSPVLGETPPGTPGGTVPISNPTQLHGAKQALDAAIDYDASSPLVVKNSAINGAQNSYKSIRAGVNDAMRDQIPGYAANQDATSALMRQQGNVLDGTKDLRAGTAAQRPDDYAALFGSLSPLEQDARRVGMRSAVDQALGTRANDLQALKTLTQGDQGWNAQNLSTAFGSDQTAALNKAIDAESRFRDTYSRVTQNSETARNTAAAKGLQDAEYDPFQIHSVHNLTMEGIAATAAAKPINAVLRLLQRPADNTARDLGLAKLSTAQGPDRDALLDAVVRAHNAVGANAALGSSLANGVTAAGAVSPAALAAVLRGRQQGSSRPR